MQVYDEIPSYNLRNTNIIISTYMWTYNKVNGEEYTLIQFKITINIAHIQRYMYMCYIYYF